MPTEPPVTTKYESADLLLKLYDLRREPLLRKARAWFRDEFRPRTAEDVLEAYRGKRSAFYRMVTTYWGMAAALVLHGAIDEPMFADANGEHIMVYARLRPFLTEARAPYGQRAGILLPRAGVRPGGRKPPPGIRREGMGAGRTVRRATPPGPRGRVRRGAASHHRPVLRARRGGPGAAGDG